MKQLFQDLKTGQVAAREIPCPSPGPGQVLIRSTASLVSPGTERMLAEFGKAGWIKKALETRWGFGFRREREGLGGGF